MRAPSFVGMLIEGRTLPDWRQYYTINVLHLGSMTHEAFAKEHPEAARALAEEDEQIAKMEKALKALQDKGEGG